MEKERTKLEDMPIGRTMKMEAHRALERMQFDADYAIQCTPTGGRRDKLTDINIMLLDLLSEKD